MSHQPVHPPLDLEEVRATNNAPDAPVDLTDLVSEVTTSFADAAAQHRRATTDVTPGLMVAGNRHWLEVALGSLISNALRHGQGTVTAIAIVEAAICHVPVTDERPGFSADFAPKAFERFTRAEAIRSTPGTWLGLALMQAWMRRF